MTGEKAKRTIVTGAIGNVLGRLIMIALGFIIAYVTPISDRFLQNPEYGKISLALLVAAIVAVVVLLIWAIRLYCRYGRFQEAFGVFWDKNYNMRCLSCKKPLKHSSSESFNKFWCSDPDCNSKYILKSFDGTKITRQEAITHLIQN